MIATVEFERRVAGARILRVVVGEFGHRKEPSPIVLLGIDEGSEIGFHRTILSVGLAIGLRVEGGGEPLLDSQEIA